VSDSFKPLLGRLAAGEILTDAETTAFFTACLRGEPSPAQVAAAVTAMRVRGETVGEITAGVSAMREAGLKLEHDFDVVDTCGTGGDGAHTYNISTAAALVAAGCGVKIAKHGTRSLSSKSGSSDVLAALGVNIEATLAQSQRALTDANICFLFAPAYHGAMRHVTPVRAELGFRTIFNLMGPLSNPAGAKRQVVGVYDVRLIEPLAEVLGRLGAVRAWVVNGQGLDEITTTGATDVAEWRDGKLTRFQITPEDVGLPRVELKALRGGDPAKNARALRDVLAGKKGPYRDVVVMSAAAALVVADKAQDLAQGAAAAVRSIDEGHARTALDKLIEASHA
jgi:anthranilate phosphoribosyltransferase